MEPEVKIQKVSGTRIVDMCRDKKAQLGGCIMLGDG